MSAVADAPAVNDGAIPVVGGIAEDKARRKTAGPGTWAVGKWLSLKHWLPKGQLLPENVLRRRHHSICVLLWLNVPVLFAFAVLMGNRAVPAAADVSLVAMCGVGASLDRFRLKA